MVRTAITAIPLVAAVFLCPEFSFVPAQSILEGVRAPRVHTKDLPSRRDLTPPNSTVLSERLTPYLVPQTLRGEDMGLAREAFEKALRSCEGLIQMELHLGEVVKHDRGSFGASDLPVSEIARIPSYELFKRFIEGDARSLLYLYDSPELGIERAVRSLPLFREFIGREDAPSAIGRYLRELDPERPMKEGDMKMAGHFSTRGMDCCRILRFPSMLEKAKRYGKELLQVIVERDTIIRRIRAELGEKSPYSAVSRWEGAATALAIWEQFQPDVALEWKSANHVRRGPWGLPVFASPSGVDDLFAQIRKTVLLE